MIIVHTFKPILYNESNDETHLYLSTLESVVLETIIRYNRQGGLQFNKLQQRTAIKERKLTMIVDYLIDLGLIKQENQKFKATDKVTANTPIYFATLKEQREL